MHLLPLVLFLQRWGSPFSARSAHASSALGAQPVVSLASLIMSRA
jgi:hypothetical protein